MHFHSPEESESHLGSERENGPEFTFKLAINCEEAEEENTSEKRLVEEIIVVVESLGQRQGWSECQGTDGDSQSFKWDSRHPGHPRPKGKQVKLVAKTTILHDAGMITGEKRAAWYQSSKETENKGKKTFRLCRRTSKSTLRKR